uniref:Uncharacterized protein n=1 Tax=Arundo donax TaxID=35708 RepID=A0A0A9HIY5_ARUDO
MSKEKLALVGEIAGQSKFLDSYQTLVPEVYHLSCSSY